MLIYCTHDHIKGSALGRWHYREALGDLPYCIPRSKVTTTTSDVAADIRANRDAKAAEADPLQA